MKKKNKAKKKVKRKRIPFSAVKVGAKFESPDETLEITKIDNGVYFTLISKVYGGTVHYGDYPNIGILMSILYQDDFKLIN